MKRKEKYIVLNALISEIMYAASENKKRNSSYNLESAHAKDITRLYHKLNKRYFKDNETVLNSNIEYFNLKMQEVKK